MNSQEFTEDLPATDAYEQAAPTGVSRPDLKIILEAALLAAGEPLSINRLISLFDTKDAPSPADVSNALDALAADLQGRGIELGEVASGFRLKTRADMMPWVSRLWEEKPQRYSRALLETLSLIAYRQPITRGEIEEVRGVAVSSNIIRTLQEREWIRVVGHRDVPGKPALFGTTRAFLDYFDLTSLDDLPTLAEIRDMTNLEPQFDFETTPAANSSDGANAAEDIAEAAEEADENSESQIPESPKELAAKDDSVEDVADDEDEDEFENNDDLSNPEEDHGDEDDVDGNVADDIDLGDHNEDDDEEDELEDDIDLDEPDEGESDDDHEKSS